MGDGGLLFRLSAEGAPAQPPHRSRWAGILAPLPSLTFMLTLWAREPILPTAWRQCRANSVTNKEDGEHLPLTLRLGGVVLLPRQG